MADGLHALPARSLAGNAAVDLRVPDARLPADRARGRERLALRGSLGAGRGAAHGRAALEGPQARGPLGRHPPRVPGDRAELLREPGPRDRRGSPGRRRRDGPARSRGGRRRDDLRGRRAVAQLLRRHRGLGRRFRGGEESGGGVGRGGGRGGLPRVAQAARRGRRRHRLRGAAVAGRADASGRAAARFPRVPYRAPAADSRAAGGGDARRRRAAGILPDALDTRAAHPAGEGDFQHLHQPGADGAGLQHPHVASRKEGHARSGPAEPREGRVPEGPDRGDPGLPAPVRGTDVQRVRRRSPAERRRGRAPRSARGPEDPGRHPALALRTPADRDGDSSWP